MTQFTRVVCPLCAMLRSEKAYQEHSGTQLVGSWDENKDLIRVQEAGGKAEGVVGGTGHYRKSAGSGFPVVESFTLEEAVKSGDYDFVIARQKDQLLKLLHLFHKNGIISDGELKI